jgi:mitochondrial fission protein ELM1
MTTRQTDQRLRVWALLGAHPGDNDQVLALAGALGMAFEAKTLEYNRWRHLGPRCLGSSLLSLKEFSRDLVLSEEPPDITISVGHRSVAVVRALRKRSGGRTRSIHIGFPRVSPDHFDLVVSTPQYPMPDHPNILRIPIALTHFASAPAGAPDELLEALPRPRSLLVVGGPALYWELDERKLREAISFLLSEAADAGGSVMVATSPRTPESLTEAINAEIGRSATPAILARPGEAPHYAELLAAADTIRVTADSVSMVSDAIWTGKPVGLVGIKNSLIGKVVSFASDHLRSGKHLYPHDLRLFWRALRDIGISTHPAIARISSGNVSRMIVDRARMILKDAEGREFLAKRVHRQSDRAQRARVFPKFGHSDEVAAGRKSRKAVEALEKF